MPDAERYVDVSFLNYFEDWEKGDFQNKKVPSRRCLQEDLGAVEQNKQVYEMWITDDIKYDIFCPDLNAKDVVLFGVEGENQLKSLVIQVEKCNPQNN